MYYKFLGFVQLVALAFFRTYKGNNGFAVLHLYDILNDVACSNMLATLLSCSPPVLIFHTGCIHLFFTVFQLTKAVSFEVPAVMEKPHRLNHHCAQLSATPCALRY